MAEVNFTVDDGNYNFDTTLFCNVGDTLNINTTYPVGTYLYGIWNDTNVPGCTYTPWWTPDESPYICPYNLNGTLTTPGVYQIRMYSTSETATDISYEEVGGLITLIVGEGVLVSYTITEDNYTTDVTLKCKVGDGLDIASSWDYYSLYDEYGWGLRSIGTDVPDCIRYIGDPEKKMGIYAMHGVVTTPGTYENQMYYYENGGFVEGGTLTVIVEDVPLPEPTPSQPSNTFLCKVDGQWKGIKSLFCKVNGSWKSVSELFAKKDGVWVEVFPGGVKIVFHNYAYPIPVASGWQYCVNGGDWITVTEDGEINTSGTFTGAVRVIGVLTLEEWFSEETIEYGNKGVRTTGNALSVGRKYGASFANGNYGYVCGGSHDFQGQPLDVVDIYTSSGTRTTGTSLNYAVSYNAPFVLDNKGFVCGGNHYSGTLYNYTFVTGTLVYIYNTSGTRTTGTSLSENRGGATTFVNGNKGYVCSGGAEQSGWATVDVYTTSGSRTTGNSMSAPRNLLTSFVNGNKGYVCGGQKYGGGVSNVVDIYNTSGTRTTGTSLSVARRSLTSFANGDKGYVCGGEATDCYSTVDVYDTSGTRTTGSGLCYEREKLATFVMGNRGYVCGGLDSGWSGAASRSFVDVYDTSGTHTTTTPLSVHRYAPMTFVLDDKGFVCGGCSYSDPNDTDSSEYVIRATVDIYYDEEFHNYTTKIPITAGTTYTLNGISGTAPTSEVLTFNEKVSGTIKYKNGVLPRCALIYNKALASDPSGCIEYTSVNKGFTPISCGSGNANEGSWASGTIFDEIEVGYFTYNGTTASLIADTFETIDKSAVPTETYQNTFVRIPKIYQRVTQIDENRVELAMDTIPFEGATLHPAFVMDGVEVNYKYIGRYLGYFENTVVNGAVIKSVPGVQPTHSLTRATFRERAKNNGSKYGLMSYYDWDLVNKLFLFAFKSFDSQTALGKGYTGRTATRSCGSSDDKAWNAGWQDATTVMSFIGLEDWWGNLFTFIDNFMTDGSYIYASQSGNPTDDVADMTPICPNPGSVSGYPLTIRAGLNDFFIAETMGGSETTGLCDQQYFDAELNGGRVGAYYGSANAGGAFYLNAQNSISSSGESVGARLVFWGEPTEAKFFVYGGDASGGSQN